MPRGRPNDALPVQGMAFPGGPQSGKRFLPRIHLSRAGFGKRFSRFALNLGFTRADCPRSRSASLPGRRAHQWKRPGHPIRQLEALRSTAPDRRQRFSKPREKGSASMSAAGSGKGLVRSASVPLGTWGEAFQPGRRGKRFGLGKSASGWLAKPKRLGGRFLIITGPKGERGDSEG